MYSIRKGSILLVFISLGYMSSAQTASQQTSTATYGRPNSIRSGFYLKMGPVIPVGAFSSGQVIKDPGEGTVGTYSAARIGGNLGLGYLVYIGPGVANNYLRFGIDASFLDAWFATSDPEIPPGSDKKVTEFWYYMVGQKFGPLITVNPVDKLMIDFSYKLNANLGWHNNDLGYNIIGQEVMMNIRYRVILVSFLYNIGEMNFNDLDKNRSERWVDISTFRVLLGFKF